jgi:hypothetical protein
MGKGRREAAKEEEEDDATMLASCQTYFVQLVGGRKNTDMKSGD